MFKHSAQCPCSECFALTPQYEPMKIPKQLLPKAPRKKEEHHSLQGREKGLGKIFGKWHLHHGRESTVSTLVATSTETQSRPVSQRK